MACVLASSGLSRADGGATIKMVHVHRDGSAYIEFDADVSAASCTTKATRMAFLVNTPGGQAILSVAMAAKLSKAQVWAGGNGHCDVPNKTDWETLAWLTLM